ncbi:capsule assembly Wzi family protein [Enterobacter chengduensis]|uniref:capsule assembly Wzi family protein n=1 Tax=Enterobacter chengduensis TaxID=2494701 RepID=UPI002002AE05|nr:capsule assembly Wzi family protein [Enterobacter chengduensis]MCK7426988.1 capsule assembly Wzi family protein [Enterobacter chengduensis]
MLTRLADNTVALALCLFCCPAFSAGLVVNDRALRDDLAWLSDRKLIRLDLSTWPLSEAAIQNALLTLGDSEDPVNQRVTHRIQKRLRQLKSLVQVSAFAATGRDRLPAGMDAEHTAGQSFSAAIGMNDSDWDITLKGNVERRQWIADASSVNPNGSYAAWRLANQWLSFGEIPQWWGPGNDASLIRSDSARPVVGVMMQRDEPLPFESPWLAGLGAWQYQIFTGQIRQYSHPEQPKLSGARVAFAPGNALELALSREIMWGGKGRPENYASFRDALFGQDNTGNQKNDPGDQLGGIDFRVHLASLLAMPVSLYGQVVGDDEAGFLPSHNTWLGGIEGHNVAGNSQMNWALEAADTRSQMKETGTIYYHYCYHGGFYQQGWPLADALGGDGTQFAARVEWVFENDRRFSLRGVRARLNRASQSFNQAYPRNETLQGIEASWLTPISDGVTVSSGAWFTQSDRERNDTGLWLQLFFSSEP